MMARARNGKSIGRVMVWPDQHFPYHDRQAHELLYKFAEWYQPNVHLHIGDCLDLCGISRHTADQFITQYENPIKAELLSCGSHFDTLAAINPKAELIWLWGNHDDRLRQLAEKNPALRGLIDDEIALLREFGRCDNAGRIKIVKLDDYEDDFAIGKLHFAHGFSSCKHVAAKHVEEYDESVMFGHAHTIQMFTKVHRGQPKAGYCIGHLVTRAARKYLKGRPTRWALGFALVEYRKTDGFYTAHLLPIAGDNPGFLYGGQDWRYN